MKNPIVISVGLFLFLFGLALAKAGQGDYQSHKQTRTPASAVKAE